jgi:hypothetical protein
MTTIRELIRAIFREVREGDALPPERAATLEVKLTALLANVLDELREADLDYRKLYLVHLRTEGKANRARIEAEATPEYERLREAKDTKELTLEMIRSLRQFLRSAGEEMRLSR